MVETITIAGVPYTDAQLSELVGYPLTHPLTNADIEAITAAIAAANSEPSPLAELIVAAAILSATALFRNRRPVAYYVPRGEYYRGRTPYPQERIDALIERERQRVSLRTRQHGQDLINRRITLRQYHERMARDIVNGNIRMMQSGAGGRGRLTRSHLNALQQQLWGDGVGQGSLKALGRHVDRIRRGELSEAQILDRSRRYGANIQGSYYQGQHTGRSGGRWQARRLLDPSARHCPDCPGLEHREWGPVDSVTPVGADCRCQGNCRCRVEYRMVNLSDSLPNVGQPRRARTPRQSRV